MSIYFGVKGNASAVSDDVVVGAASDPTTFVEVRVEDSGGHVVTRREMLMALKRVERHLMTAAFPATLPKPTGEV